MMEKNLQEKYSWMQGISEELFRKKYMINSEESEFEVFDGISEEIASVEKTKADRLKWSKIFFEEISSGRLIPAGRIVANARKNAKMPYYNNCYTIGIEDSIEDIYKSLQEDAMISRTGGGVGLNFSNLRPKNASLSSGGDSSGVISFMKVFDQSAKVIHTGGSRRAAHIGILNVDHPEIEDFITCKRGDENKQLTQFNISVGITDKFIKAVEEDLDWELKFDGEVFKVVKAKYLYELMTKNAYIHNEPGILNIDTVNKFNNGYYAFDIDAVNPCFTGDTIIAIADGRNGVSIKELAEKGEEFQVYSGKEKKKGNRKNFSKWKAEIKKAVAFKTGEREVMEVFLSDGSSFKCTPEHKLALPDGTYVEAKNSLNKELEKFYTTSNKNTDKSYRTINSRTNGYSRQYRMMWEYNNGEYDGKNFNIDHIDEDSSNDIYSNLQLMSKEEHKKKNREGFLKNNPLNRIKDKERLSILQRQKNVLANAKRYSWSQGRINEALSKLPELKERIDENVDLSEKVFVEKIEKLGIEAVYDLTVDDNHNFYIITKTDDEKYLNSSGVLVHNCGEICVIGDTKVNTDFGILKIKDLIERKNNGEKIKVYSVNKTGELELKNVEWGDKTGVNSQLIEIELANGKILKLTPNHKLFISPTQTMTAKEYLEMWNNLGIRAKRRGEYPHLVHLNRSMRNEHYIKVKASTQKDYVLEHHFNFGEKIEAGWNVHHLDENTLNNSKVNLEKMLHSKHSRITNEGHPDYSQGVLVKKKSIIKQTGDVRNTGGVKNVKWGGTEDVYDITVSDNHNFFAEGVLIHNCMPAYSLCCLSAINLTKFVIKPFTPESEFDFDSFRNTISYGIRFLDNVLDATKYPLQKIEDMSKDWRRIGLGFTGLGDMFAMIGIKYGSEQSKGMAKILARTLRDSSYETSVELAVEKGKFPAYDYKINSAPFIMKLPIRIRELIKAHGLRNVAMNTIAPTGTTSLTLGQNCSSGIEPIFSLDYERTIRTGRGEDTTVERIYDYAWLLYQSLDRNFGKEIEIPESFVTTFDIDINDAMDIQAIFQEYIDHSISKTLNLPIGTTYEEYSELFMRAYKLGLKGFTTFNPEGSMKGILSTGDEKEKRKMTAPENNSAKRPDKLVCDIHQLTYEKEKYLLLLGKYNDLPYEVFVTKNVDKKFGLQKNKEGVIKKSGKSKYSLVINDEVAIDDIVGSFDSVYGSLGRFISMSLRHRVPLQFIIEQLNKDKNFMGFERIVSRVLKKYLHNGEEVKTSSFCPECGNTKLVYEEGCLHCKSCGWSKCS